jgi:hypothetical protein
MASYDIAEELKGRVAEIKTKFESIICQDVDIDEIGILWNTSPKSAYKAKMIKVAEYGEPFSMPTFILVVWKAGWEQWKEGNRNAIILHELMHMGYDPEKGKYYIRKHDIEDFREIISVAGLGWEKVEEIYAKLEEAKKKKSDE